MQGTIHENTELQFSHPIQTCPIPCLRFIHQIGQMNLEASRFGKHAVQHIHNI
ncbi:hypothetical protein DAPPUDRAFT_238304 [Daphnia pulex]|uniref:Uncharacterized protein n=1 Tax=Daphnia pulex TaxID=6669 RepID=E9G627_DAPPU|nr:hypothetical protein DAPPUDRAFT_238304 [Daphnia pulex]|eukprot:EFX84866.1 hypothetical protein DAPPUDRAFT_238304 [Daphnia pulex]